MHRSIFFQRGGRGRRKNRRSVDENFWENCFIFFYGAFVFILVFISEKSERLGFNLSSAVILCRTVLSFRSDVLIYK